MSDDGTGHHHLDGIKIEAVLAEGRLRLDVEADVGGSGIRWDLTLDQWTWITHHIEAVISALTQVQLLLVEADDDEDRAVAERMLRRRAGRLLDPLNRQMSSLPFVVKLAPQGGDMLDGDGQGAQVVDAERPERP